MIKLQILGHVGNDATAREVTNGQWAISFSVAHSEKYKTKQGVETTRTTWVNCTYWRPTPKIAEWIRKGAKVLVEGQPSVHVYQKSTGETAANIEVRVITLDFASHAKDTQPSGSAWPTPSSPSQQGSQSSDEVYDDDLPF